MFVRKHTNSLDKLARYIYGALHKNLVPFWITLPFFFSGKRFCNMHIVEWIGATFALIDQILDLSQKVQKITFLTNFDKFLVFG